MDDKLKDYIVNVSKRVFKQLGSGHSESIYQKALLIELHNHNFHVDIEYPISVEYMDTGGRRHQLNTERIDVFIHQNPDGVFLDNQNYNIILELKATTKVLGASEVEQVKKYLREFKKKRMDIPYGILINFPQPNNAGVPESIFYKVVSLE